MTGSALPTDPDDPRVEIRRSTRRRKSVSARQEGETVVVLMPAGLSRRRERELVVEMLGRLARSGRRRSVAARGDDELGDRAAALSRTYLGGRARPTSVRWVPPMSTRWGSCSPDTGQIRISETLRDVPGYVLDYVLVHELAHLAVPGGHTSTFWEAVRAYPRTERAMGYLEALARSGPVTPGGSATDEDDMVDGGGLVD